MDFSSKGSLQLQLLVKATQIDAAIDFYTNVFGALVVNNFTNLNGHLVYELQRWCKNLKQKSVINLAFTEFSSLSGIIPEWIVVTFVTSTLHTLLLCVRSTRHGRINMYFSPMKWILKDIIVSSVNDALKGFENLALDLSCLKVGCHYSDFQSHDCIEPLFNSKLDCHNHYSGCGFEELRSQLLSQSYLHLCFWRGRFHLSGKI